MVPLNPVLIWLPDSSVEIPILIIILVHDCNKHFYSACFCLLFFLLLQKNTEKYAYVVNIESTLSVYILHFFEFNCMSSMLCP